MPNDRAVLNTLARTVGPAPWYCPDIHDNLLVLVATGDPRPGRIGALVTGVKETRFQIGIDQGNSYVAVPKQSNRLVVILPDGRQADFVPPTGLARRFSESEVGLSGHEENFLRRVGKLLESGERHRFDSFVENYREPAPERR
jgi:hypothetical protein